MQPIAKGFTNHEQTDPSGLIYMQARFYLPMWGRFASPDPARDQHFEETQSWNIYSYVQNNPVMNIDPTGESLWDTVKGVANGWTNSNFGVQVFSANNSKDYMDGVVAGDVAALLQAGHETAGGLGLASGGAGLTIASGGTAAVAGVPALVAGAALTAHGTLVAGAAVSNLSSDLPAALSTGGGSRSNPSKMQKEVEKGKAPKEVDRVDKGKIKGEKDHVHLKDKSALNNDGTVKHGEPAPAKQTQKWLEKHGWKGGPNG